MSRGKTETRPLEALGITDSEETVYACLISHPGATAPEIACLLAQSPQKTQRLLSAIEAKGLATHAPEHPRRYIPAAPDIAMEALALKRQEHLQSARARIQELKELAATTRRQGDDEQIVELIVSQQAQIQAFDHLRHNARRELVCLTRPPVLITPLGEREEKRAASKNSRGLSRRCIIDQQFLDLPGAIEKVRCDVECGESTRILPDLPLKFILADHRVALLPLNPELPGTPSLLVRSSALLEALYALFELLWQTAAPICFSRSGSLGIDEPERWPGRDAEDLLAMLAAGFNDKTIAYKLDVSLRTLKRRISDLMRQYNVRTRFQLAWAIAQRFHRQSRAGLERKRGASR